jgi:hypothetical protein
MGGFTFVYIGRSPEPQFPVPVTANEVEEVVFDEN